MARTGAGTRLSRRNYPYSVSFPGLTSAYISLGDNYSKARTDAFAAWGYFIYRTLPDTSNDRLLNKFSTVTSVGWAAMISGGAVADSPGSFEFLFGSSAAARIFVGTTEVAKPGIPYFWAFTYDGSQAAAGVNLILLKTGKTLSAFSTKNTPTTDAISGTTTSNVDLRIGVSSNGLRQWDGLQWGVGIANANLSLANFQDIYYHNIMPSSAQSLWLANSGVGNGTSVTDEIGAITGTIVGTAVWNANAFFQPRLATRPMTNNIIFNANNDNVSWSDNASLDVTQFTIETWVKFSSLTGASQDIVSKYDQSDAAQRSFDLFLDSSNRLLGLVQISGSPTSTTTTNAFVPVPNTWYHIGFTFNGSNGIIYVNGKERTRSTAAGSIDNSTAALRLGLRTNGTTQCFQGSMALFRLFGSAATAAQIQDLYFKNMTFTTPVVETLMSEGSGTSLGSTGSYSTAGSMTSVGWGTDFPIKNRSTAGTRTAI